MNHQDRRLYAMRYLHGTPAAARLAMRAMALQWNFHIPSDLVVDRWSSDGAGNSTLDFRFLHDSWTTIGRSIGRK